TMHASEDSVEKKKQKSPELKGHCVVLINASLLCGISPLRADHKVRLKSSACYSLLHWVQIKLSASVPARPEGATTHTVLSYVQTPLHAADLQRLPKAREERSREVTRRENVGQRDAKKK
ncbi:hypothetical protein JOQ06_018288, partial [Pogonophryne albipinna]